MTRRVLRSSADEGRATAFVVVIATGMLAMAGLVLDGGLALASHVRAGGRRKPPPAPEPKRSTCRLTGRPGRCGSFPSRPLPVPKPTWPPKVPSAQSPSPLTPSWSPSAALSAPSYSD